jgi:hypothetical protein
VPTAPQQLLSNETRGLLRVLFARVEADGRRVERAVDKIPTRVLRDVARKGKVGASIVVRGIFVNTDGRPGIRNENFWLCVTRHAIGRLLDRSRGKVDVVQALYSAHDRVMGLAMSDAGQAGFATPDVLVPSAGGMFIAQCRRIGPRQTITAIARTWVDDGQAYDDQLERARVLESLTWP